MEIWLLLSMDPVLYLGSAIGTAMGGILLHQNLLPLMLATIAGVVALAGAIMQFANLRKHLNSSQNQLDE